MDLNPTLVNLVGGREVLDTLRTILSADDDFVTRPGAGDTHFALNRLGSAPEEVEHCGRTCTSRADAVCATPEAGARDYDGASIGAYSS